MTETTQNYYYVESDRDLLKLLFDQLPCQSLEDLLQLLDQKHIASFKDILDYASGPDCPNDLSLTIEVAMDRLRRTDMRRSSDWAGSSKIGNYLANKLLGQKQEQFWVLYFDQQQNLLGEKNAFPRHPGPVLGSPQRNLPLGGGLRLRQHHRGPQPSQRGADPVRQ